MKTGLHSRISKSAFHKGEYIGHCFGAQRIQKTSNGWQTVGLASQTGYALFVSAPTLNELGDKLDGYEIAAVVKFSASKAH